MQLGDFRTLLLVQLSSAILFVVQNAPDMVAVNINTILPFDPRWPSACFLIYHWCLEWSLGANMFDAVMKLPRTTLMLEKYTKLKLYMCACVQPW